MASIRWAAQGVSEGSTVTVNKGVGTSDGDRLVVIVINDGTDGAFSTPSAPRSGQSWTTLSTSTEIGSDELTPKGKVYEYKTTTDAALLPASWTFTPPGFVAGIVWMYCIQDLDPAAEIVVSWGDGQLPSSPSEARLVTAPSISSYTGQDPILLTAHCCTTEYADPTYSTPSGMTARGSVQDAQWMTGAGFSQSLTGTSATGTKSSQISGTATYKWRSVAVAIPSPITAPQQDIEPDTVAAPAAPYEPTLSQLTRIAPSGIAAPAAPYQPTVIPGTVTVTPATIAAPAAPNAPKLVQIIRPGTIAAPAAPEQPLITQTPRPPLRIDFWAVDDDGSILCPLPTPTAWQLTMLSSEQGAVVLEYPRNGINFHVLDERVTSTRDLYIRIRTDGSHTRALGAILQSRDGDEVSESDSVKFIGVFHTQELDEAVVLYNDDDPKGETRFAAATAGEIMDWLLTSVQSAGYLKAGTKGRDVDLWWTFTDTHDSAGTPWPNDAKVSPTWPPGKTLLAVAQQLRDWGLCEVEVTTDHEVRLYVPGSVGTDRTLSDPPLVLRRGLDLTEAPRKTDVRDAITDIIVVGNDGVHVALSNATALAQRGRKIAGFMSEGNVADSGSATALGQIQLDRLSHGLDSLTHNLTFDQRRPTPLRELMPTDWAYSDTGAGLERKRVSQITVAQRPGAATYSGGIVLGDLLTERDVSLQRQINKIKSGSTIPGTSEPAESDGVAPAAPEGVTADSIAYKDGLDTYATLLVDWLPVTTNEDGSAATDIAGYRVRWILANDTSGGWVLAADTPQTSVSFGGVASGVEVFVQVAAYDRDGNQSEWSASYAIETETDLTPPPTPSAPTVHNQMGLLMATWDGLGSEGEPMPADFRFVEVHVSIESSFEPDETTLYDRLHGAGTMPITRPDGESEEDWYGVTRYVRLVAVDWTSPLANRSDPSEQGSGTPAKVLSDDIFEGAVGELQLADLAVSTAKIKLLAVNDAQIGDLSVGKLSAGTFSASLTLSGIFRTGTSGARGEWDSTSFRMYNASGTQTIGLVPGGVSFITGEFRTALTGQRMVINPGGSVPDEIRVFPSASGDFGRIMARTAPLDGSAAILIDGGAASGVGRGRLGAYKSEAFVSYVTNDAGGDTSSGFSRTAVSCSNNEVGAWAQTQFWIDKASGGSRVPQSRFRFTWTNGEASSNVPTILSENNSGLKFDAGALAATTGTGTSYAAIYATNTTVPSLRAAKQDIDDITVELDPLATILAAPSYRWRYKDDVRDYGDAAVVRFGPMVEDLPEVLHRPMPNGMVGLSNEDKVGLLWAAVRELIRRLPDAVA